MLPLPSDKKFFPEELRQYSDVCKVLDKSDDNKILITSTQLLYTEIHKSLKFYNQGCKERKVVILKNPPKMVNGKPQGTHWDIHQASTDSDDIQDTRIIGNGYCALVTAIVAIGIFDDQFDSNEFIDGAKDPKNLKKEFYNDWKRILDICPDDKTKAHVQALMGSNASRETWLNDDTILKIINHNINGTKLPNQILENHFDRSAHFERKIAFLRHLNQASGDEPLNMINNGLGGITLEELLSGSGEMNSGELELHLSVLNKFKELLNSSKNIIGPNQINPEAVINFYNLMTETILGLNLNDGNCIEEEKKIKLLQDSFNEYFELKETDTSEENKKKYQSQKNTTRERLLEKLSDPIKKQKGSFLNKINKKVDEGQDKDFYYKSLEDASNEFGKNFNDDFKSKISKLENTKLNNQRLDDVYHFLLRNDSTFLEAMLPDSNQLKPQFSYSGWGKKIEFSDCKITFDGKEVVRIFDGNEDEEAKENIISKLYKDYQGDPKRFQLGVIDFFRNTKSVELAYEDNTVFKLDKEGKKMFKYNLVDGRDEFQVVQKDDLQKEEEEKDIKHFKTRLDAYLNPPRPRQRQAPPTSEPPHPPKRQKDVTEVKQPDKEIKKKMLAEIKKHIDLRFELLDNLLENKEEKIIVIIPGSCKEQENGSFVFKHSLGTDLAKGQWKDIGLANEGEECVKYINDKITDLYNNNQGRVLFGNIGIKTGSSGNKIFHPQFPLYDASYNEGVGNLKDSFYLIQDDDKGLELSEENYKATFYLLEEPIPTSIERNSIKDRIILYQAALFGESGILEGCKFVHVFGANVDNVNNKKGTKIMGGGQVKALENQQMGIFGIVTTPKEIFKVEHFKKLHAVCNTYGSAESQKKSPSPHFSSAIEKKILAGEKEKAGHNNVHLG